MEALELTKQIAMVILYVKRRGRNGRPWTIQMRN
jgi:hypothetical protein